MEHNKQMRVRPYFWVYKLEEDIYVPVTPTKTNKKLEQFWEEQMLVTEGELAGAAKKLNFGRKQACPQKRPLT